MSLRVIGVGLHRTGSLSTKVALERLGFGPCYHGFEFVGKPDHLPLWLKAIDNGGHADWHLLFEAYGSALDWPMVFFWEKLVRAYPEAKVILTHRDPDSWYVSHLAQLPKIKLSENEGSNRLHTSILQIFHRTFMVTFSGELADRAHCIDVYNRHCELVRRTVPPNRLLVYSVTSGWQPLCDFLGVTVPDEPFPHVNSTRVTAENTRRAMRGAQDGVEEISWL